LNSTIDDPFPQALVLLDLATGSPLLYLVNGLILLILLMLSAMVSGSEVAFFSLPAPQIAEFRNSSATSEKRIYDLIKHPNLLLATILILNNLINVAFVTLSTYLSWSIAGTRDVEGVVILALTVLVTMAIVFFGEVVPKVYANQNNVLFARFTAPGLILAQNILRPLSVVLISLSNIIEKRMEKKGYQVSMDELNQALEMTTKNETTEEEKDILKGIVNFGTITVKQIMKSRLDVTAFDIKIDFHELMDRINKCGYSRLPIYNETIDKIEGVLYIKDLLPFIDQDEKFEWQKLLRPGFFVPESKKINDLLKNFQDKRVHLAIVVDEYGGTSGLITMEDVIEEIVGEINDEFDDEDIAYNKLDENTFVFEGKTSLNDFCKIIGEDTQIFEDVKGESESLGGLILELNTKLPRAGEKIYFDKYVFTIVSVDAKRIKRVRVLTSASRLNENAKSK